MRVSALYRVYAPADGARSVLLVVGFVFLMMIAASVRIPLFFTPVPFTMQTLVVYVSILFLRDRAFFSQLLYVTIGIAGLPVFTNAGAGLLYLAGPTGGYLIGFMLAAAFLGRILPQKRSLRRCLVFFSLAACAIYSCGLIWLVAFHGFSLAGAFFAGVVPFLPAEVVKVVIASSFAARSQ